MKHAIFVTSVVGAFAWAVACNQPTEIFVTVTTDVPCAQVTSTAITVGTLATIQGKDASSESFTCDNTGALGSLVVTPSGADDAEIAIEVALGTQSTSGADCLAQANNPAVSANCIYALRDLHFSPHQRLDVTVSLATGCLGVVCPAQQTCDPTTHACVSPNVCDGGSCADGGSDAPFDGPTITPAQNVLATTSSDVTCAVGLHGLKCWGDAQFGETGLGKALDNELAPPNTATLPPSSVAQVSGGGQLFCAFLTSGVLDCWGNDAHGEITPGTSGSNVPTPTAVNGLGQIKQVQAGFHTVCVLTQGGSVSCWGANNYGQVGNGTPSAFVGITPVSVSNVTALGSGPNADTFCAIVSDALKCWGSNAGTQLEIVQATVTSPVDVGGFSGPVTAVTLGHDFLCALIADGSVQCIGKNNNGQIGDATTTDRTAPTTVKNLSGVKAIAAGYAYTCAILGTGAVECWGANDQYQIGDGTLPDGGFDPSPRTTPSQVVGLTSGVQSVSAGFARTCVMTTQGDAKCWGSSPSGGSLGDGVTNTSPVPVDVTNFP